MAVALQLHASETNGLFYVSSGERASIRILQEHVYSENNANTDFGVRLDTSDYRVNPKTGEAINPMKLRVGGHEYSCSGGGGNANGTYDVMWFSVPDRDEAEAVAKWFSVDCGLRSPPGYKLYSQFIPSKVEFHTDEPVTVKFQLKNLDDRTVIFQRGGQQRGERDNQYGFRAILYEHPVPDAGNPVNFGGLCVLVPLEPNKMFEDQIDLKKWFAFDKPGTYMIHGFYQLDFYRAPLNKETFMPWNEIWHDYASADFTIVVK